MSSLSLFHPQPATAHSTCCGATNHRPAVAPWSPRWPPLHRLARYGPASYRRKGPALRGCHPFDSQSLAFRHQPPQAINAPTGSPGDEAADGPQLQSEGNLPGPPAPNWRTRASHAAAAAVLAFGVVAGMASADMMLPVVQLTAPAAVVRHSGGDRGLWSAAGGALRAEPHAGEAGDMGPTGSGPGVVWGASQGVIAAPAAGERGSSIPMRMEALRALYGYETAAVVASALEDGGGSRVVAAAGGGGTRIGGGGSSAVDTTMSAVWGSGGGGGGGVGSAGGGRLNVDGLASEAEDRLLEAARQLEARVEGVFGALAGGLPGGGADAVQGAPRATTAAHTLIREVWEVVDANYLDARATGFDRGRWAELRDAALALPYRDTAAGYRAVRDMLARGLSDPYCRFIGPSELQAMKKYDVSGVGLNLGTAAEYVIKTGNELPTGRDASEGEGVLVVGVSRGSTADRAGVRQGDELLAIQGESLSASTPFRAAGLIAGVVDDSAEGAGGGSGGASTGTSTSTEAEMSDSDEQQKQQRWGQQRRQQGSPHEDTVTVTVRHASGQIEDLSLHRPRRTLPSTVTTSLTRTTVQRPDGGRGEELVGTVRLAAFNARAQSDVAAAIRQLEAAGASRLVLDLRDNRGGLVTEGLEVAKLFLEGDAPIVITERRAAAPDTPRASGPPLTSAPLLVLVNGHTASASEIVAGALRDNCRAVLAGSRTYGKGLIQSVYELSDGSGLVVTVGKYMTPRGTDIDRYGIRPDYSSVPSAVQYDSAVAACKLAAVGGAAPQVRAGG